MTSDRQPFSIAAAREAAAIDYPPFEFEADDGTVHRLTHPLMMDGATQARLAELQQTDDGDAHAAFMAECYPTQWAAIQELEPIIQRRLMEAMTAQFGEGFDDSGKSSSPPSATPPPDKPSKRTSPSAASTSGGHPATKRKPRSGS